VSGHLDERAGPELLVDAIEENQLALTRLLGASTPGAEVHERDGLLWIESDIPHPLANAVLRARIDGHPGDAIQAALEPFARRRVPMCWIVGPSSAPHDLPVHLRRHGLAAGGIQTGMAADISSFSAHEKEAPGGLQIREVTDEADLERWRIPVRRAFGFPPLVDEAVSAAIAAHALRRRDVRCFLGLLGDEPVAGSMLAHAGGVAGIYNVATLPAVRRRGIGTALTRAALAAARHAGDRWAVLLAEPAGEGVYRALGFRPLCRIQTWLWPA
jgi:ribosomal protein S18 acetylase RimI-like enzyme